MSTREGTGYVPGLGAFRPYPPLVGAGDWQALHSILQGVEDQWGRKGAEALIPRLRTMAEEAVFQSVRRRVGYRWCEMSDREWLELALEAASAVRAVYERGEPRTADEYAEQNQAYRAAYAWLAAVLFWWAEAAEWRQSREGKEG